MLNHSKNKSWNPSLKKVVLLSLWPIDKWQICANQRKCMKSKKNPGKLQYEMQLECMYSLNGEMNVQNRSLNFIGLSLFYLQFLPFNRELCGKVVYMLRLLLLFLIHNIRYLFFINYNYLRYFFIMFKKWRKSLSCSTSIVKSSNLRCRNAYAFFENLFGLYVTEAIATFMYL